LTRLPRHAFLWQMRALRVAAVVGASLLVGGCSFGFDVPITGTSTVFRGDPLSCTLLVSRVAHSNAFSGNPATVQMQVDDVELAPYAELPSMNINMSGQMNSCPQSDTTVEADLNFHVVVNGL
jgi:hypothetical protein